MTMLDGSVSLCALGDLCGFHYMHITVTVGPHGLAKKRVFLQRAARRGFAALGLRINVTALTTESTSFCWLHNH